MNDYTSHVNDYTSTPMRDVWIFGGPPSNGAKVERCGENVVVTLFHGKDVVREGREALEKALGPDEGFAWVFAGSKPVLGINEPFDRASVAYKRSASPRKSGLADVGLWLDESTLFTSTSGVGEAAAKLRQLREAPVSADDESLEAPRGLEIETPVVDESTRVDVDAWLDELAAPPEAAVVELDPPAIPLDQMTLEQRQKWADRKKSIENAVDRFFAKPAPKTVLRPWVKVALAFLVAAIAAAVTFGLRRHGIATLALLLFLGGCGANQQRAASLAREIDSVLARVQPDDRLDVVQRAKLAQDEKALKADAAAIASDS